VSRNLMKKGKEGTKGKRQGQPRAWGKNGGGGRNCLRKEKSGKGSGKKVVSPLLGKG